MWPDPIVIDQPPQPPTPRDILHGSCQCPESVYTVQLYLIVQWTFTIEIYIIYNISNRQKYLSDCNCFKSIDNCYWTFNIVGKKYYKFWIKCCHSQILKHELSRARFWTLFILSDFVVFVVDICASVVVTFFTIWISISIDTNHCLNSWLYLVSARENGAMYNVH